MSDLSNKLTELQAQLAAAKGELEAAKTKAAQTTDLHEKLNHITRARAAQDVINDLEREISAVRAAIAEAERQEHRQELLERARSISHEMSECQSELDGLLSDIAKSVRRLQRQAPQIISRWRQSRERWIGLAAALTGTAWPSFGGDIENTQRLTALERVLTELGPEGQNLLQLPPGLSPSNRLEYPSHEGKNWHAAPPESPEDFARLILDTLLSRPFSPQPAAVPAPDPALSL